MTGLLNYGGIALYTDMAKKIQGWGKSVGARVPIPPASEAAFAAGEEVKLRANDGGILVQHPYPNSYQLWDLLEGVTEGNRHRAIASGDCVKREVW
jgi:antitoxin component of MazEF toxin-antitoxin module